MNTGPAARNLQTCWVWLTATWHNARPPGSTRTGQLSIAYNATLQLATAALAAAGYRASREAHHYRVLQSLAYTLKVPPSLNIRLDKFRKKRNVGGYERAGLTSDQEAKEMLALAITLRKDVEDWIRLNFPGLM